MRSASGPSEPAGEDTLRQQLEQPGRQQRNEDRVPHAPTGQAGPFVIIFGQFRGQGCVGRVDDRKRRVIEDEDDCVVEGGSHIPLERGRAEHEEEAHAEGQRAQQHERTPPPPTAAEAVAEDADQRVVDAVPEAADDEGNTGQPHVHAHDADREIEPEQGARRRGRRRAPITQPVNSLGQRGQPLSRNASRNRPASLS